MKVTKRQIEIRDFIREFYDTHGYGPLPRDIAEGCGGLWKWKVLPGFIGVGYLDYLLVNMEIEEMIYRTLNGRIRVR